jgi:hypothetical protein
MALETVQQLQEADGHGVQDALSGKPNEERPTYRERSGRTPRADAKAEPLAAAHPRGVGALVDVRA